MSQLLLEIKELEFAYHNHALLWSNLNFELRLGQRIGIVGPNGCGKSTLFNLIMGLLYPTSGQIYLNEQLCKNEAEFARHRHTLGYVFQDADDQLFCPTVFEDIAFGPRNLGIAKTEVNGLVDATLDKFGITHLRQQSSYQLSGGEKRMVALASIWTMQPKALLLDEPTLSLDEHHYQKLIQLLTNSGLSWIIVSHDYDFLTKTCNELWQVENRQLCPKEFL